MKIDKVIMSCDDSHYKYYWPVAAQTVRKLIKATPVLFMVCDEETDFYFDGHGLVKKVLALPNVSSGIQSIFYRMYGTKFFQDEICLISDIDMLLLDEDYFQGTIKDFDDDSFVVYTSDAYDIERDDSKNLFSENIYGMCYNAAKGKIFEEILDIPEDFSTFIERIRNYNIEKGVEWYGDEVYLTNRVNLFDHKYIIHRLKRGVEESFVIKDRIEKWHFPVEFVLDQLKIDNERDGNYDEHLLRCGYYKDCHCVRPYGYYKDEIHKVADIACEKDRLFSTIEGLPYTSVNDRCLVDDGCIVDLGSGSWGWSKFFIGKKRVIGADVFGKEKEHTELFKGIVSNYNGSVKLVKEDLDPSLIDEDFNDEIQVKTWKEFCYDYNIGKISVLKMDILGSEYDLINSMDYEDFEKINQVLISFYNNGNPEFEDKKSEILKVLEFKNFEIVKPDETKEWYLAVKKKVEVWSNKRKLVLISSFCDTQEKKELLLENIIKIKKLGLDTMVIAPNFLELPYEVIKNSDYLYYTKENPLLGWPVRDYSHWFEYPVSNTQFCVLHRGLADYGWAGLYQTKKVAQIGLTYDYDVYFHMIYDVEVDSYVAYKLSSDDINYINPRKDPQNPEKIWDSTLHFMCFSREMMQNIEKEITLEKYLSTNGVAEGEVLKWIKKYKIKNTGEPIRDVIYYWNNYDFFNVSPFPEFKMFISKNPEIDIWLGYHETYSEKLTSNLRMVFYSCNNMGEIDIVVNGQSNILNPEPWVINEINADSQTVDSIKFIYKGVEFDYTEEYRKLVINKIFYNYRNI